MKENFLVWKFEAFREYLSYEVLRNAAQVLSLYEGEEFNIRNNKVIEMQNLLSFRTNKNTWMPNRSGEVFINVNAEGDVYRNKGRLLTSMLLIFPKDLAENKIKLTEFGNALARGYVTEIEFYNFIICNYKYPHPAYAEDYNKWLEKGMVLLPFILILQLLICLNLYEQGFITTSEIAHFVYNDPNHNQIDDYVSKIVENRNVNAKIKVDSSDKVTRKINDILGFLTLSGYIVQVKKSVYSLNLEMKTNAEACIDLALSKYSLR